MTSKKDNPPLTNIFLTDFNQINDDLILQDFATIYNYWLHDDHEKNQLLIERLLSECQDQTSESFTTQKGLELFATRVKPKDRSSIAGVFDFLIDMISDQNLKVWLKEFANAFEQEKDKNFVKKTQQKKFKKRYEKLLQTLEEERVQAEEERFEKKKLAKRARKKGRKLEKKNKVESPEKEPKSENVEHVEQDPIANILPDESIFENLPPMERQKDVAHETEDKIVPHQSLLINLDANLVEKQELIREIEKLKMHIESLENSKVQDNVRENESLKSRIASLEALKNTNIILQNQRLANEKILEGINREKIELITILKT